MLRFAVRRLILLVPILLGLSLLVFLWIRALPGSPAEALLGERATDQSIEQIRDQYGLDDPFYEQYWRYLQTVGSGDLGTSIRSRRRRVRPAVTPSTTSTPTVCAWSALTANALMAAGPAKRSARSAPR